MINTAISFIQKLSNRELAIAIWLLVAIICALSQYKIREALLQAIKAPFVWTLVILYFLMFSYITFMLLSLNALGCWRLTHFFPNIMLWVVCIAFVMFFEYDTANDQKFFKNAIKDNLKIMIVLEFLINLYVFDLWVELLLVPISIILGVIMAFTETDKKHHIVHTFLNYIITITGLGLLSYALYMVVVYFKHFATFENFENFYLPILLTIMFLPFIYFMALYVRYELLFNRLHSFVKDKDRALLRYVKKKTLLAFGLNLWRLGKWSKHINTLRFMDEKSIDKAIQEFKNATPLTLK